MDTVDVKAGISAHSRECVILLHGYGARVRDLSPLATSLGEEYDLFSPDLKTLYSYKKPLTFTAQVEALRAILARECQGRSYHLVGLSYGGALAWAVAATEPKRCLSLSLINPMGLDPVAQFRPLAMKLLCRVPLSFRLITWALETAVGQATIGYMMGVFGRKRRKIKSGRSLRLIAQMLFGFCYATKNENWEYWRRALAERLTPALILFSQHDPLFRQESFEDLGSVLHAEKLIALKSGEHLPGTEHLERAAIEIRGFVRTSTEAAKSA